MWFMCRLFSPRRRSRDRSGSDSGPDQRQQSQRGAEEEEEQEDASAEDSVKAREQERRDGCVAAAVDKRLDTTLGGVAAAWTGPQRCAEMESSGGEEEDTSQDLAQGFPQDLAYDPGSASNGEGDGGSDGPGDVASCRGQRGSTVVNRQGHDGGGGDTVEDLHGHLDQIRNKTLSAEDTDGNEGLKEQLAMVEAMVQDMKVSFMSALDQLFTLQEGDAGANSSTGGKTTTTNNSTTTATAAATLHRMDSRCHRQDQHMSDLAKVIDSLRKEMGTLSDSMQQVVSTQQSLQDQVTALQSGQHLLLQELVSAGLLATDKSREMLNKCRLQIQEGRLCPDTCQSRSQPKVGDSIQGSQDQEKTDVTAAACKSLSLTQALAAGCQDIDVSDSSEEDITSSRGSGQQGMDHRKSVSLQSVVEPPERRQATQDIVDSEQEYCSQLWGVIHSYQQPLQDGHYMSSRQLGVLFPSPLGELYQHHSHLLQSLQDRLAHASYASAVGDVFARMTDTNSNLLGLYQEYVESLPGAISCLRRQMSQSRSFRGFVKQVLRHTGEDHPDHFHLQASLGKLQDFVERFNHDITHTTQAIALDLQHLQSQGQSFRSSASNSSCDMLPPTTSTIDSGIQSTGEDTLPPSFLRSSRALYDGYHWADQTYHHTDPRPALRLYPGAHAQRQERGQRAEWQLSSHSQPDLSHSGGYAMPSNVDPQAAATHLRPYANTGATAGNRSARHRRYKIKKRVEGQGHYGNSSTMRPASAIDFADGGEHDTRDRGAMRPHSVLGPFPGDGRSRVIQVHGRQTPRSAQHAPPHHHAVAHPQVLVNGHWDPAAGGDPMGHQASLMAQGAHHRQLVDYDDEEDDTRALSDPPSTSSRKASSRHSHEPLESETDNSDDFSQEDLAAALSLHLNNGVGGHPPHIVSAHELRMSHQQRQLFGSPQPTSQNGHHYQQDEEEDEEDDHVDVHLDSTGSDLSPSLQQIQKPPKDMSEELKLDLTCFQDKNETKPTLLKRSQPAEPPAVLQPVPLSMKPLAGGGGAHKVADTVPQPADRFQTEPSKEVVSSLAGDKSVTSLPPIHPQDGLPTVADTNGRLLHAELERPPVRRSITPSEFSTVTRPAVLRRAATPSSEYLGTPDPVSSKGGRRRKEGKNTSNEALHRSVDDVSLSSASKKKPFRTSLKNLFQRKKGCIILDELEREYTKELVRICLVKDSTTTSTTTTTLNNNNNNNNNVYNHSPQTGRGEEKEEEVGGEEENEKKKNGVSPNRINLHNNQGDVNSNHRHHLHSSSSSSLWSRMKKSPLFSLSRGSDDTCVL
ncbi:hypothetical protein ACOMHN_006466 [Nucella lapillus]